jgi:HSP20 family protein
MTTRQELQTQARRELRAHNEPTRTDKQYLPAVDIYETAEAVIVEAEMPGIDKTDVELSLKEGVLNIFGKMTATPVAVDKETVLLREFEPGSYLRRFSVAESIDQEKISAVMADGMLTLTLPKQQPAQPKKIAVKAA